MRGKVDGEARLRYSWSTTDFSNRYQYQLVHATQLLPWPRGGSSFARTKSSRVLGTIEMRLLVNAIVFLACLHSQVAAQESLGAISSIDS